MCAQIRDIWLATVGSGCALFAQSKHFEWVGDRLDGVDQVDGTEVRVHVHRQVDRAVSGELLRRLGLNAALRAPCRVHLALRVEIKHATGIVSVLNARGA